MTFLDPLSFDKTLPWSIVSSSIAPTESSDHSATSSTLQNPFQATQSASEAFFYKAVEAGLLDEHGRCLIDPSLYQIPALGTKGLTRLNERLDRKSGVVRKSLERIPVWKMEEIRQRFGRVSAYCTANGISNPFHIDFEAKTVEIRGLEFCLRGLFAYMLTRGWISSIELNGGDFASIAGEEFYVEALSRLGEKGLIQCFNKEFWQQFEEKASDFDVRINFPGISYKELNMIGDLIIEFFAHKLMGFEAGEVSKDLNLLLKELAFAKLKHTYELINGHLDHFYLLSFEDVHGMKIDINLVGAQIHRQLFHANGLSLNIIELLRVNVQGGVSLVPWGETSGGWQSVFDKLGGIIGVSRMDLPFKCGWSRLLSSLVKGQRCLHSDLESHLLQDLLSLQLPVEKVIDELQSVIADHNQGSFEALFSAVCMASVFLLSLKEGSKDFVETLWQAFIKRYEVILESADGNPICKMAVRLMRDEKVSFVDIGNLMQGIWRYRMELPGAANCCERLVEAGGRHYVQYGFENNVCLTLPYNFADGDSVVGPAYLCKLAAHLFLGGSSPMEVLPYFEAIDSKLSMQGRGPIFLGGIKGCREDFMQSFSQVSLEARYRSFFKALAQANQSEMDRICYALWDDIQNLPLKKHLGLFLISVKQKAGSLLSLKILRTLVDFDNDEEIKEAVYGMLETMSRVKVSDETVEILYQVLLKLFSTVPDINGRTNKRGQLQLKEASFFALVDKLVKCENPLKAYKLLLKALGSKQLRVNEKNIKELLKISLDLVSRSNISSVDVIKVINGLERFPPEKIKQRSNYHEILFQVAQKCIAENAYGVGGLYLQRVNPEVLCPQNRSQYQELQFQNYQRMIEEGEVSSTQAFAEGGTLIFSEEQIEALTFNWISFALSRGKIKEAKEECLRLLAGPIIDCRIFSGILVSLFDHFVKVRNSIAMQQLLGQEQCVSILSLEKQREYLLELVEMTQSDFREHLLALRLFLKLEHDDNFIGAVLPYLIQLLKSIPLQSLQDDVSWDIFKNQLSDKQNVFFLMLSGVNKYSDILLLAHRFHLWKIALKSSATPLIFKALIACEGETHLDVVHNLLVESLSVSNEIAFLHNEPYRSYFDRFIKCLIEENKCKQACFWLDVLASSSSGESDEEQHCEWVFGLVEVLARRSADSLIPPIIKDLGARQGFSAPLVERVLRLCDEEAFERSQLFAIRMIVSVKEGVNLSDAHKQVLHNLANIYLARILLGGGPNDEDLITLLIQAFPVYDVEVWKRIFSLIDPISPKNKAQELVMHFYSCMQVALKEEESSVWMGCLLDVLERPGICPFDMLMDLILHHIDIQDGIEDASMRLHYLKCLYMNVLSAINVQEFLDNDVVALIIGLRSTLGEKWESADLLSKELMECDLQLITACTKMDSVEVFVSSAFVIDSITLAISRQTNAYLIDEGSSNVQSEEIDRNRVLLEIYGSPLTLEIQSTLVAYLLQCLQFLDVMNEQAPQVIHDLLIKLMIYVKYYCQKDENLFLEICLSYPSICDVAVLQYFKIFFFYLIEVSKRTVVVPQVNHPRLVRMMSDVMNRIIDYTQDEVLKHPRLFDFFDAKHIANFWNDYFVVQIDYFDPKRETESLYVLVSILDNLTVIKSNPTMLGRLLEKLWLFTVYAEYFGFNRVTYGTVFNNVMKCLYSDVFPKGTADMVRNAILCRPAFKFSYQKPNERPVEITFHLKSQSIQRAAKQYFSHQHQFCMLLMNTEKVMNEVNAVITRVQTNVVLDENRGEIYTTLEIPHEDSQQLEADASRIENFTLKLTDYLSNVITTLIKGHKFRKAQLAELVESYLFMKLPSVSETAFQHHLVLGLKLFELATENRIFDNNMDRFCRCFAYCGYFHTDSHKLLPAQLDIITDAICGIIDSNNVFKINHAMNILSNLSQTVYCNQFNKFKLPFAILINHLTQPYTKILYLSSGHGISSQVPQPLAGSSHSVQLSGGGSHASNLGIHVLPLYKCIALSLIRDGMFLFAESPIKRKTGNALFLVNMFVDALFEISSAPLPEGVDFMEDHIVPFLCKYLPDVLYSFGYDVNPQKFNEHVLRLGILMLNYVNDPRVVDKKEVFRAYERLLFIRPDLSKGNFQSIMKVHHWIMLLLETGTAENKSRARALFETALSKGVYVNSPELTAQVAKSLNKGSA